MSLRLRAALSVLIALAAPAAGQMSRGAVTSVVARQWAGTVHDFFLAPKPDPTALLPIIQSLRQVPLDDPMARRALAPVAAELARAAQVLSDEASQPKASEDDLLKTGEKTTALQLGFSGLLAPEDLKRLQGASTEAVSRLGDERRRRLTAFIKWVSYSLGETPEDAAVLADPGRGGARKTSVKLRPSAKTATKIVPAAVPQTPVPFTVGRLDPGEDAAAQGWWDKFKAHLAGRGPPAGYVPRRPPRVKLPPGLKLETVPMLERYQGEQLMQGVTYLQSWEAEKYMLALRGGKLYDRDGRPFSTGTDPYMRTMIVMDAQGYLYAARQQVFKLHHSSLIAGRPAAFAGEIEVVDGEITFLSPRSGHYQPGRALTTQMMRILKYNGVDTGKIR